MSTQENLFYSKIPSSTQPPLSQLERDVFGDISIPQLLTNYSKLSSSLSNSQSPNPSATATVNLEIEENSQACRVQNAGIGTYSTLERTSMVEDHYERENFKDTDEAYTKLDKLTKFLPSESHYESMISSDDITNAKHRLKISPSDAKPRFFQPILYTALYRFVPRHSDEIELLVGDMLELVKLHPDLWVECKNQRTGQLGMVPNQYVVLSSGDKNESIKPALVKETFRANFIGSVSARKSAGREVAKEAMSRILSERRRMQVTTVQPVLVEVTGSGVTTHVIDPKQTQIPPIHFSIQRVTYSAVQGTKSLAYIVRDPRHERFTCYVYETEESVDQILDIFQRAFDFYKQSIAAESRGKS